MAALIRHLHYCTLEEESLLGTLLRRQQEEGMPRDPGQVRVLGEGVVVVVGGGGGGGRDSMVGATCK